jgi:hypothetical protein
MSEVRDPVSDDEPPFYPLADPDAPEKPDWDNVEPEGEQFPDAGEED